MERDAGPGGLSGTPMTRPARWENLSGLKALTKEQSDGNGGVSEA